MPRSFVAAFLTIAAIPLMLRGQAPPSAIPFTQAQATAGARVYEQKCASCHGVKLDDGQAPPLAGPKFLDMWTAPGRTLDELLFITRSTMPKNEAGTLTSADYVSVVAYMLERNGVTAGDRPLPADVNALAAFRLTRPSSAAQDKKAPAPAYIAGTGGLTPRLAHEQSQLFGQPLFTLVTDFDVQRLADPSGVCLPGG
jgi:mono/diheme cytochrome c family protein